MYICMSSLANRAASSPPDPDLSSTMQESSDSVEGGRRRVGRVEERRDLTEERREATSEVAISRMEGSGSLRRGRESARAW